MSDDTYNGWANQATWLVSLHLNNDQQLQNATLDLVADAIGPATLEARRAWPDDDPVVTDVGPLRHHYIRGIIGYAVRDWVEDLVLGEAGHTPTPAEGLATDLILTTLGHVEWNDVAEAFYPEGDDETAAYQVGCDYCREEVDVRTCHIDWQGDPTCSECAAELAEGGER